MDDKLDLLEGVPLFSGVSREGLEELGAIADELDVPAGTALTHERLPRGLLLHRRRGLGAGSTRHGVLVNDPRTRATTLARSRCCDGGAADGHGHDRDGVPARLSLTYGMFHELLDSSPIDPDRHPRGGRPASPRAGLTWAPV